MLAVPMISASAKKMCCYEESADWCSDFSLPCATGALDKPGERLS
jgi:hypothetical protein